MYHPDNKNWESERDRKQAECSHHFFITKCSLCGMILCSDHTHENKRDGEILIDDEEK